MSETVTITACEAGRDWSSDDGKINLTFYETTFERNGSPFKADWAKQRGGDPPEVGESVEVDFFEKNGKQRVKFAKGSGGGSGGGKSPDQQRSIVRQHSQEMALRALDIGAKVDWTSVETVRETIREWTDWFEADANKAAKEGGGEASHTLASPSSPAPAPSQNGQTTHERITVLLEAAGVNDVAARTISDFALTELTAEEQDAAIEMLENETRRGAAVKRLSERTVKATGGPLPRPSADESIPF